MDSQKLSLQFERNFLLSFHIKLRSYLSNGVNILCLNSRNTPANSPNMSQKQQFYHFNSLKNGLYDSNDSFYSHFTAFQVPRCAMASKSYGLDIRNIAKSSPRMTEKAILALFSDFSNTFPTIRTIFFVFLNQSRIDQKAETLRFFFNFLHYFPYDLSEIS